MFEVEIHFKLHIYLFQDLIAILTELRFDIKNFYHYWC